MSPRGDSGDRKRRHLTREEHALWHGVVRSVKPLRPAEAVAIEVPIAALDGAQTDAPPTVPPPRKRAPAAAKPLAPLARRDKQRLARGTMEIDARIDLHGMTQARAHDALLRFLRRAQVNSATFVLVITGKGARTDAATERGVLKRQVPLWLGLPEFRAVVSGFEDAHVAHGGGGALYVRVRRSRGARRD